MEEVTEFNPRWQLWGKVFFLSLAALSAICVLAPDLRQAINEKIHPEFRTVLSSAMGDVLGSGTPERIIKVKTEKGLFIEIYEENLSLVERIPLEHNRDGYFMFDGEASNLVLDDVDGDSAVEILVPSYDKNLIAHLNIYSFNRSRNSFVKLN